MKNATKLRLLPGGQLIVLGFGEPERLRIVELVQVQLELGGIDAFRQRTFQQHGQRLLPVTGRQVVRLGVNLVDTLVPVHIGNGRRDGFTIPIRHPISLLRSTTPLLLRPPVGNGRLHGDTSLHLPAILARPVAVEAAVRGFTAASTATIAARLVTGRPPALPQPQHVPVVDQEDGRLPGGIEILLPEGVRRRTILRAQRTRQFRRLEVPVVDARQVEDARREVVRLLRTEQTVVMVTVLATDRIEELARLVPLLHHTGRQIRKRFVEQLRTLLLEHDAHHVRCHFLRVRQRLTTLPEQHATSHAVHEQHRCPRAQLAHAASVHLRADRFLRVVARDHVHPPAVLRRAFAPVHEHHLEEAHERGRLLALGNAHLRTLFPVQLDRQQRRRTFLVRRRMLAVPAEVRASVAPDDGAAVRHFPAQFAHRHADLIHPAHGVAFVGVEVPAGWTVDLFVLVLVDLPLRDGRRAYVVVPHRVLIVVEIAPPEVRVLQHQVRFLVGFVRAVQPIAVQRLYLGMRRSGVSGGTGQAAIVPELHRHIRPVEELLVEQYRLHVLGDARQQTPVGSVVAHLRETTRIPLPVTRQFSEVERIQLALLVAVRSTVHFLRQPQCRSLPIRRSVLAAPHVHLRAEIEHQHLVRFEHRNLRDRTPVLLDRDERIVLVLVHRVRLDQARLEQLILVGVSRVAHLRALVFLTAPEQCPKVARLPATARATIVQQRDGRCSTSQVLVAHDLVADLLAARPLDHVRVLAEKGEQPVGGNEDEAVAPVDRPGHRLDQARLRVPTALHLQQHQRFVRDKRLIQRQRA
uniref:Uncharacterized protein n=1 Tax=Anopheles farauti TaxID=69004 RepID=A0A182QM65_9DIPT